MFVHHNFSIEFDPTGFSSDEDLPLPRHKNRTYMNQPHLCFEITSEDGFSVKANSIEGKSCYLICSFSQKKKEWFKLVLFQ